MGVINRMEITGLFGHYNYNIPLITGSRKGICFLTGPNGYGKSTLLQLIYAFLKTDARALASMIFDSVTFYMKDYKVVILQERMDGTAYDSENDDEQHESVKLTITVYSTDGVRMIERSTFEDREIENPELPLFPPTLSVYLASLNVEYVRDDRLLPKNANMLGVTSMVSMLQQLMKNYDEQLTALYNMQLVDTIRKNKPAEVKYDEIDEDALYERALKKIDAFNKVGLATKLIDSETANDEPYLKLMQMTAVDRVLDLNDKVYSRLNLLYSIIDEAEFSDKKLLLDSRNGLYFVSGDTIVIPENLSSGEQHFIVQAITLLIQAKPGSLILIDEPELSYHPAWQMDYLKNIKRIAEVGHYQFILATHSPQIFDYRWNYTIDLYKQTTDDAD